MRKLIPIIATFIACIQLQAQRHELGLFLGGGNGITDIGRTNYISPFAGSDNNSALPFVAGAVYRFNFNPQMGLRANLLYSQIVGDDLRAVEDYRLNRGLNYDNDIIEGSIVFEYNFFDFNTIQKSAHTPYVFAGIGAFGYNQRTYTITHTTGTDQEGNALPPDPSNPNGFTSTLLATEDLKFDFTTPFGVGYKLKYNWQWVISAEVGFRPTNTDRLDHSTANFPEDFTINTDPSLLADPFADVVEQRNIDIISRRQTGDLSDNDWYVFTGFSVTYTFGRPPCYCD